jgi:hypothetical protein
VLCLIKSIEYRFLPQPKNPSLFTISFDKKEGIHFLFVEICKKGGENMSDTIHVTPHPDGGWQVKRGGASRASSRHDTQKDALDKARDIARKEGLELVIHRPDGRIRAKDSYGNDPYPPKG